MTAARSASRPVVLFILVVATAILLGGCAAAPLPTVNPAPAPEGSAGLTTADVDGWLDGVVASAIEREGIAGAIVSVVHDGEVVTERAWGMADTGAGGGSSVLVDNETLFRIGSISKLVTATAVMQLVEGGQVSLDAPAQEYLDFELPDRFDKAITLRHLLSHTAGFEDRVSGVILPEGSTVPALRDEVSHNIPEQIFKPGTMPAYSNYSNALAAYIVAQVADEPYEEYVQREIFDRAGMSTASLGQPLGAASIDAMSRGYEWTRGAEIPFEMVGPAPAGAVSASAADMSAFMIAQLGGADATDPLLSARGFDEMHNPAVSADSLGGLANGPRMTIGFFEDDRNRHRIIGHGGDLTAFHAQLQLYPDAGSGIFVAMNSSGIRPDSSTALRDQLMHGFSDRYYPDAGSAPEALATSADHASIAAGTYLLSRRNESTFATIFWTLSSIAVTETGDGTVAISAMTDASGAPLTLAEVEPWVWQEVGGQHRVAMDVTDGRVAAIGLNPAFTLQPMPTEKLVIPMILLGACVILLVVLLAWPIGWIIRRHYGKTLQLDRTGRRLRLLTLFSALALAIGAVGWVVIGSTLLGNSAPVPEAFTRTVQVLTGLGTLGFVPADWQAIRVAVRRGSWRTVALNAVVSLGFAGIAYVAIVGGLLSASISY